MQGSSFFFRKGGNKKEKKRKKQPHSAEEVGPKFLRKLLYTKLCHLSLNTLPNKATGV